MLSKAETVKVIEEKVKGVKKSDINKFMTKCVVKDTIPKEERKEIGARLSKAKVGEVTESYKYRLSIDPERLITTFGDQAKE